MYDCKSIKFWIKWYKVKCCIIAKELLILWSNCLSFLKVPLKTYLFILNLWVIVCFCNCSLLLFFSNIAYHSYSFWSLIVLGDLIPWFCFCWLSVTMNSFLKCLVIFDCEFDFNWLEFCDPKVRIEEFFLESLHLAFEFSVGKFQISFSNLAAGLRLSLPVNHCSLAAPHSTCLPLMYRLQLSSLKKKNLRRILGTFPLASFED